MLAARPANDWGQTAAYQSDGQKTQSLQNVIIQGEADFLDPIAGASAVVPFLPVKVFVTAPRTLNYFL